MQSLQRGRPGCTRPQVARLDSSTGRTVTVVVIDVAFGRQLRFDSVVRRNFSHAYLPVQAQLIALPMTNPNQRAESDVILISGSKPYPFCSPGSQAQSFICRWLRVV